MLEYLCSYLNYCKTTVNTFYNYTKLNVARSANPNVTNFYVYMCVCVCKCTHACRGTWLMCPNAGVHAVDQPQFYISVVFSRYEVPLVNLYCWKLVKV